MSCDLVKFILPAPYITSRVRLRDAEIAYGYIRGWLDEASTVRVAESLVADGAATAPIEELATLLRSEYWRVQEVVSEIDTGPAEGVEMVWLYLALSWLYDNRDRYEDPFQMIEMLYADFDYPDEIDGLVRFMPAMPGSAKSAGAIEARWRDYLQQSAAKYAERG